MGSNSNRGNKSRENVGINGLAPRDQATQVMLRLEETYPDAHCELNFSSAFELLVATVLSAQTTDKRVNEVTPALFKQFPDAHALAGASLSQLQDLVRPLGMFRRRSEALQGLGLTLTEDFGGEVPRNRKDLTTLPGVGRKTANVVLGNWFGQDEITVDTHVGRLSRRLGWTQNTDPVKVEKDLWELLPDAPWTKLCHQLILHGRRVCLARSPHCAECTLLDLCPQVLV